MRRLAFLLVLLIPAPAAAQRPEPEWRQVVEQQVLVRIGAYEPGTIRLVAGRPTRLAFYNNSRARLSLSAPDFFRTSHIRRGDERLVAGGGMTLEPGETRAISLVPTEGSFQIRSRSWFRRLLGMSARIIVEPAGTRQQSEGRSAN